MSRFFSVVIIMVITMVTFSSYADQNIMVGAFSQSDLSGWEEKSFKGNSVYELTGSGNQTFLRASTDGMASGMFREVAIDLTKTPWINWSWRVENTFRNNNERTKEGDDYAARVYVVVSGGLFFWKTRAVNYVWSSHEPAGSIWSNAYTENARMVAVRSGDQQVGQWQTERRNVREDLKALFEEDITRIDAVAVMIDGDNTGQSAVSYFGDIFFSTH